MFRAISRNHAPQKQTLGTAFEAYYRIQEKYMNKLISSAGTTRSRSRRERQEFARELKNSAHDLVNGEKGFFWATSPKMDPTKLYSNPKRFGELLGVVSTQWTMEKFESEIRNGNIVDGQELRHGMLNMPHSTQLMGTMCMAGLASTDQLQNHFIKCGTGEGKSVCLGLTATIFALLGYEVFVVCYNKKLSDRDYGQFSNLFYKMGVQSKIHYSTISDSLEWLMERNNLPDLRTEVTNYLEGKPLNKNTQVVGKSLLLVDEVDVLFSDKFYGNSYNPCITITEADELLKHIYDTHDTETVAKIQYESYIGFSPTRLRFDEVSL